MLLGALPEGTAPSELSTDTPAAPHLMTWWELPLIGANLLI